MATALVRSEIVYSPRDEDYVAWRVDHYTVTGTGVIASEIRVPMTPDHLEVYSDQVALGQWVVSLVAIRGVSADATSEARVSHCYTGDTWESAPSFAVTAAKNSVARARRGRS